MKIRKIMGFFTAAAIMLSAIPAVSALDKDSVEPWERSAETHRENLKNSIA